MGKTTVQFECEMQTRQCASPTGCKLRVRVGLPYCAAHLASLARLRITRSPIAGRGLFAWSPHCAVVFEKGDTVGVYDAEPVTNVELTRRYGNMTAPYGIESSARGWSFDAAGVRVAVSLANDPRGSGCRSNTRFTYTHPPRLVATRCIRHGQEILVSYGREYWRGHGKLVVKEVRRR